MEKEYYFQVRIIQARLLSTALLWLNCNNNPLEENVVRKARCKSLREVSPNIPNAEEETVMD